jgi:flagellar biosynthetic protein FliQ|uniref:Flagellar biosynthetic protein FliQ n=1 Tax=Schlesneria paludicola TaxID=360056 RepID=A0A7C4QL66_9PLAN
MSTTTAIELSQQAVLTAFLLCLPTLAAALVVGLLVSIGQAVTQLQDQTLSFLPKLAAMVLVMLYTLPWTLHWLIEYATHVIRSIPTAM